VANYFSEGKITQQGKDMKKQNLIFIIFFLGLFFALAGKAQAACTWVGNTGTTASCFQADIASCLAEAATKSGDVVVKIKTGDCTSSPAVNGTILNMASNWAGTKITVQGENSCTLNAAGQPSSCPTKISGRGFDILGISGKQFIFQDLEIKNCADAYIVNSGQGYFRINGTAQDWRLTRLFFNTPTSKQIGVGMGSGGRTYGLIDHNRVTGGGNSNFFLHTRVMGDEYNAWAEGLQSGTSKSIFMEANIIEVSDGVVGAIYDSEAGGKAVIRYNTFKNAYIASHDVNDRATRGAEIYNNTFTVDPTVANYGSRFVGVRGGQWIVYNNNFTTASPNQFYTMGNDTHSGIGLTYYPACNDAHNDPWNAYCDSNSHLVCIGDGLSFSTCTQNQKYAGTACNNHPANCIEMNTPGNGGRPCRDQTGYNHLLQPEPSLFWNNKRDGVHYPPAVYDSGAKAECNQVTGTYVQNNFIRLGYEYCDNATTMPASCNGIATTYTAYTCPHPLTGLTGICDSNVAGTGGYNIQNTCTTKGDLDCNTKFDAYDISSMINIILKLNPTQEEISKGDMNTDNKIDSQDLNTLINEVLK